ncbi:PPC domain-containing DNA-binding protein, partial [Rhizobiaceae sp. 2RAB30]
MKSKLLSKSETGRTFVVVLDSGEEAFGAISEFATAQNVTAAAITAIGAFERATVGWFDFDTKNYREIPIAEQCEVLSAIGDVAAGDDGRSSLHLHAVLGFADGSTRGGHLL